MKRGECTTLFKPSHYTTSGKIRTHTYEAHSLSQQTTVHSRNPRKLSGRYSSNTLDSSLSPTAKEIARLRGELKLLRDKHYALQAALREAATQSRTKDMLVEQLRERNRSLDAEAGDLRRLADERRLEVRSMERFLTKTDRWAGSDLVQAVKDINNEILQFAAAASEGMAIIVSNSISGVPGTASTNNTTSSNPRARSKSPQDGTKSPTPSLGRRKALERVAARFGSKMRQCLEKRDHMQDPTLLQYALQACVCQCISHAMSSFCFGSTGKLESHLSKIYSHMHATGTYLSNFLHPHINILPSFPFLSNLLSLL